MTAVAAHSRHNCATGGPPNDASFLRESHMQRLAIPRGVFALALGLVALGLAHALLAALASGAGALGVVALARRAIGGQTGDVAGAAQQFGEIAAWCGLLIGHAAP